MDISILNEVLSGGYIFALTFGAVSAVNIFYKHLESKWNLALSFAFALVFAFIPVDLGNVILTKIKDAFQVAIALNGSYQFLSGLAKKVSSSSV